MAQRRRHRRLGDASTSTLRSGAALFAREAKREVDHLEKKLDAAEYHGDSQACRLATKSAILAESLLSKAASNLESAGPRKNTQRPQLLSLRKKVQAGTDRLFSVCQFVAKGASR
jgi:hypothetical protein